MCPNSTTDPLAAVWDRVRSRPPRCLSGVVARRDTAATRAVVASFGGGGEFWEIAHPDPAQRPVLFGHFMSRRWPECSAPFRGLILLSPLTIRWEPCGDEAVIYDGARRGYNPEHDLGRVHTSGWAGRARWHNPDGPSADPALVACFGDYQFDPAATLTPAERDRPEDFFGWFTLFEVDRSTGRVSAVTEYECA